MKKIFLIALILLSCSAYAWAELSAIQQNALVAKINKLTATREANVGMAFIDLKTGWQFSVNGTTEYPTASVIKLAVLATAYHLSELGELDLKEKLVMYESDRIGGSGVLQWMKAGRAYTLWNLNRMMIVLSDNIATKMLVDRIGMPQINAYMKELDLDHTQVVDHTMLIEPPSAGVNLSTPLEMAYLVQRIKEGHGFSLNSSKEMLSFMRNQRYRWGIWRGVAPGTIVADKTGNLDMILNDVGVVYSKSGNYILSIFTRNMKKREARILINNISRVCYEEYTGEKVVRPKQVVRKKKKVVIKRKLSRRPSVKSRPTSGHRGAVSGRKLPTSPRR